MRGWLLERHVEALRELGGRAAAAGDLPGSIRWTRQAIAADPLRETAHRDLMRRLGQAGDRQAARRQYTALEALLQRELGEAPAPETRALLREIESEPAGRAGVPASSAGPGEPPRPPDRVPASEARGWRGSGGADAGGPPALAGRLPRPLTALIGREGELARASDLLRRSPARLLTLTSDPASSAPDRE